MTVSCWAISAAAQAVELSPERHASSKQTPEPHLMTSENSLLSRLQ